MIDIQKLKALAESAKASGAEFTDLHIDTSRMYPAEGPLVDLYEIATPAAVIELIAEIEQLRGGGQLLIQDRNELAAENERLQRFETAYKEFSDKTDWLRPNAATHELGMHVADVIRKRCDDLTAHCQAQADEIKALRKDASRLDWLGGTFGGIDVVRDQIDAAMALEQQS